MPCTLNYMTKRILIADDEPNVRQLLELVLRGQGYEVTLATNGAQLVRMAQERIPDLVLVDLMMPQLD
jgi:CheY-like chemotaxis protein